MAEYTLINLITFLIGVGFLGLGYRLVKRGREDVALFVVVAAVGIGLVTVALIPGIFTIIARLLGLELKARAILVLSNLTLFVLTTYLLSKLSNLYTRVSRLNEELSLLQASLDDQQDE